MFRRSRDKKGKLTRILYASDFHGSEAFFRKFLGAALEYEAQVLIVGGDVTGKAMIPIVHQGGGRYVGHLFGGKEEPSTPEELEKFKQKIRNVGFYPIVLEKEEAQELEADPQKLNSRFEAEMKRVLRQWLQLAEETLAPRGISLYFMPGNDDIPAIDQVIEEFEHVKNPDMQHFWIDEYHELVGLANSNMTPWSCPRDVEEEELRQKLGQLESMLEAPERAVVVIHVPPHDSGLDVCPELDENLRIVHRGGQILMKAVGSTAVREFIERVQPLLSLHGHIHEAAGHTRIGRTLAINSGSEYAEGIMRAAIINLEPQRVRGHMLISG
jgi:Icc-related predicted phosphoesterase